MGAGVSGFTPPRSTTSWPLMNTQASSSAPSVSVIVPPAPASNVPKKSAAV
jgi:hypothetical protein